MRKGTELAKEARLAGAAGILFSVLSLIVVPLSPELGPPLGATADEIAGYYVRHRSGFLVGNYLGIAAFLPGFVQLVIVSSWVRRREDRQAWLGTLVLTTGTFAYAVGAVVLIVFQAVPFLLQGEGRVSMLGVASLANVGFSLFCLAAMPFLASLGWATLATGVLPRWFGWTSLACALGAIGVSLGALVTEPRWLAAGGLATGLGFFGFFAWTFVLALLSFRGADDKAAESSTEPS
jgi:hypothetical protein